MNGLQIVSSNRSRSQVLMFGFNDLECNLLTLSFQELSHKEAEGAKARHRCKHRWELMKSAIQGLQLYTFVAMQAKFECL